MLTNIDRTRTEYIDDGTTMERSIRAWAGSLTDDEGKSLQCDAENGGADRNAYLFAPRHHLEKAKKLLLEYRERLRIFGTREKQFHASEAAATGRYPNEIYVPTAAVTNNLDFMMSLTASEHWWEKAPPSVKAAISTPTTTQFRQPVSQQRATTIPNVTPPSIPDADETTAASTHSHMSATHSNMTSTSVFEARFAALENSMKKKNKIFQDQQDSTNKRFDSLQQNILQAMENSQMSMIAVNQMSAQINTIQQSLATLTAHWNPTINPAHISKTPCQSPSRAASISESTDSTIKSPIKKKVKRKSEAPGSVQYQSNTDPAGRDKC